MISASYVAKLAAENVAVQLLAIVRQDLLAVI